MSTNEGNRIALAVAAKLTSVSLFVIVAAMVKSLDAIPTGQIVFFRSAFAIPVIIAWVAWLGQFPRGLSTRQPFGHVWRGLLGTSAMALSFTALTLLPLPVATLLNYVAPLLVVILSIAVLGEAFRWALMSSVLLGLVGVGLAVWPQLQPASSMEVTSAPVIGVGVALLAALFAAAVQVLIRKMIATEAIAAIVFWFSMTSMLASLLTLPFGWVIPQPQHLAVLILAGLLGGLAQMLMTTAYRFGDASVVAPFDYWAIVLALILGVLVYGDIPDAMMLTGAAIIVGAGLTVIWQERRSGRRIVTSKQGVPPHG